ncbi:hypothetical protein JHD50_12890 [Sulfurimonas sp. MAG313]|nr:hypothetical protein [Sulfurimonas sp. MAG313]MDF1882184.1 hypothetical protein [Sulfurimonas sp. MAG313]
MIDYKLKLFLTVISSVLFSLILIMLALVLPIGSAKHNISKSNESQTKFQKMSEGMKQGF